MHNICLVLSVGNIIAVTVLHAYLATHVLKSSHINYPRPLCLLGHVVQASAFVYQIPLVPSWSR